MPVTARTVTDRDSPPLSQEEREELASAEADFLAGRVIEHSDLKAWLERRVAALLTPQINR